MGKSVRKVEPGRHAEKRLEILEAAGRCFTRDGLHGATIASICAEAGISPGHLYHYFDGKEAMVRGIIESRLERASERFRELLEKPDSISTLIEAAESIMDRPPKGDQSLMFDMLAEAPRNPALAKILIDHGAAVQAVVARFIQEGQARGQIDPGLDAQVAAAIFLSLVEAAKAMAIRDPNLNNAVSLGHLKLLISRFLTPPVR